MDGLKGRVTGLAIAVLTVLFIGTCGFVIIEHYPVFDALYMSLITITTVGYSEIIPLTRAGRVFNTFLLLFGVGTMFYAIGLMTQTIIELQLGEFFGRRRVRKMIDKLKNHYIVCGYGRIGRAAALELQRSRAPFVVLDTDPGVVERAAKRDDSLREAGIERAKGLIGALATDADNLFLILSAKALNPGLRVSSRVNEEEAEDKLRRAGADSIFRPYNITGYRLAQSILRPYLSEFMDITSSTVDMGMNIGLEQVRVAEGSDLSNKSLKDMQLRRDLGVIVLAIRNRDGNMLFNPPADAVVHGGDYLIVMGNLEHLGKLTRLMAEQRK